MSLSTSELNHQNRNWLELPYDITANILLRIGMVDMIENAQKVCTLWSKICKDPAMWRVTNMNDLLKPYVTYLFEKRFKHVIDRSQGQLVDITFVYDYNDALLQYVADRSSSLRYLKVTCSYDDEYQTIECLTESLMKFPLLEELSLHMVKISKKTIETVGRHCPKLKTLKLNHRACKLCVEDDNEEPLPSDNEIAVAIGGSLHELRHLELIGNKMSNFGLQVILDGCQHLETLDLRECFYIDLKGNLVTRCKKQINHLKLPTDSLESDPYVCVEHDTSSDDSYDDYYGDYYDDYSDYSHHASDDDDYVDDLELYDGYNSR